MEIAAQHRSFNLPFPLQSLIFCNFVHVLANENPHYRINSWLVCRSNDCVASLILRFPNSSRKNSTFPIAQSNSLMHTGKWFSRVRFLQKKFNNFYSPMKVKPNVWAHYITCQNWHSMCNMNTNMNNIYEWLLSTVYVLLRSSVSCEPRIMDRSKRSRAVFSNVEFNT